MVKELTCPKSTWKPPKRPCRDDSSLQRGTSPLPCYLGGVVATNLYMRNNEVS